MQPDFVESLLIQCQRRGYHTTLDTCGYTSWKTLSRLSKHADLIHYDIKHLNPELHRKYTDVTNERILDNLKKLAGTRVGVVVRVPLLRQINDQDAHLTQLAWLIKRLGSSLSVTILPYHSYGVNKYASLGMSYGLGESVKCTEGDADRAVSIFRKYGIPVTLEAH
jgi:pyruvate formate lyase activating enzyme